MFKRRESKQQSANRRTPAFQSKSQRGKHQRRLLMEGLEQRQLMAAGVVPTLPPNVNVPSFVGPRNIGTVGAFVTTETEAIGQIGINDSFLTAQVLPLGNLSNQESTIDLTGSAGFVVNPITGIIQTDIDVYAIDLKAGDILDVAALGSIAQISVYDENSRFLFGTSTNNGVAGYSNDSPLQTVGNVQMAQVIPRDGRYYILGTQTVGVGVGNSYTYGLRTYRPVTESLPVGAQQILYIDFDGGFFARDQFTRGIPVGGIVQIPSLEETLDGLPQLNLTANNPAEINLLIDKTLAHVNQHFRSIARNGTNGDFANTGIAGEYGITILNSRDHADPVNNPLVTRVIVGGTTAQIGIPGILGVSPSGDIGNFDLSEIVLSPLDLVLAYSTQFPFSPSASVFDAVARTIAVTISHEAAHSFGIEHTNGNNNTPSLIDQAGPRVPEFDLGVGIDMIFGTADDQPIEFVTDTFDPTENYVGTEFVPAALSHVLSTGTVGGAGISGRVFNDLNRNGSGTGDVGIAGVTVFVDTNVNGVLDANEPRTLTAVDGTYTLSAGAGTVTIGVQPPPSFLPSPTTSRTVTLTSGGSATGVDFGFFRSPNDITGRFFADNNGNGFPDTGDAGIAGIYVYLDLDGDDRPDLGEPATTTSETGTYRLELPNGVGPYTIRYVTQPGFLATSPVGGEHVGVVPGDSRIGTLDFGLLPSRDYGDLPASYGIPSHGIVAGLSLGTSVDRETAPQANDAGVFDGTGDDTNGPLNVGGNVIDDEDGVLQLEALGPGSSTTFQVTTTNNSSTGAPAYLSAWFDFNRNNVFDASERVISNRLLGTATTPIEVNVPADITPGVVNARFRYSQTQNLGPGGDADTGEVEDYQYTILEGADLVNPDTFPVSRNTAINLDILANDFMNESLTINNFGIVGQLPSGDNFQTRGLVELSDDGRQARYIPQPGFVGQDYFTYTVRNEFGIVRDDQGNPIEVLVTVNVTFQSNVPIAIDDTFEITSGSSRALNVLDNDIPSSAGGLSISGLTAGSAGGTLRITGGGQSLTYTPLPGTTTETFTYSVIDGNNVTSTANVTVNVLPNSRLDDLAAFSIETLDFLNETPISSIQSGKDFKLRVYVEDVRTNVSDSVKGLFSAFLDVLYTDELVAPADNTPNDNTPFDIAFGRRYVGSNVFQQSDTVTPGLLDDLGGTQPISNQQPQGNPNDPINPNREVLFTITMRATGTGVAIFQADPADEDVSETLLLNSLSALDAGDLRLGRTELVITPASNNFTSAIDDSFPDGRDSNGNLIASPNTAQLRVLDNDLIRRQESSTTPPVLGAPLAITEFEVLTVAKFGTAVVNPGDDFISYTPRSGASGLESFTYFIVTEDGTRSSAQVTFPVGNAVPAPLVDLKFALTDANGNVTTNPNIGVGDTFGVQIIADDLRGGFNASTVYAAYLDVLYDADFIRPLDSSSTDRFDFDVEFGPDFDAGSGRGSAARLGIIDEFGTQDRRVPIPPGTAVEASRVLATLFFQATASGSTRVVGSPADGLPFQDTLVLNRDPPIPVSQIRYNVLPITIGSGSVSGEFPRQNTALPPDVNNDGVVTPVDALTIINEMNRQWIAGFEGESAAQVFVNEFFTDVSGDKQVTAVDALMVINYLNLQSAMQFIGEGEAAVSDVLPRGNDSASQQSSRSVADASVAMLSDDSSPLVAAATVPTVSSGSSLLDAPVSETENADEDDVLDLLAADIAGLWG